MARKYKQKRTTPDKYDIEFYERKVDRYWNLSDHGQANCDRGNFKGSKNTTRVRKWSCDYNNSTANKLVEVEDGGRVGEVLTGGLLDSSWWADGQVDCYCDYNSFIYYPQITSQCANDKLWAEKRPRYSNYPAILKMEAIGYLDVLMACKRYKYKNNLDFFSIPFKPFVIQQSMYAGRMLARKDDYYLDATNLAIYNKKTGAELRLNELDEEIFFPFQKWWGHAGHFNSGKFNDYLANDSRGQWYKQKSRETGRSIEDLWEPWIEPYERKNILRKWSAYKYFGSQLKTEHYIPNEAKRKNYLNSLVGEGETIISVEPININTTPKEDYVRYILEHVLGREYYDYNDDLIFTVKGIKYIIDWDLTEYRRYVDYVILETILLNNGDYLTMEGFEQVVKNTYHSKDDAVVRNIMSRVVDGSFDFSKIGWNLRYSYGGSLNQLFEHYKSLVLADDYRVPSDYSFACDMLRFITNINGIHADKSNALFNVYRWYIYFYSKRSYLPLNRDGIDVITNKPILFSPNIVSTISGTHNDKTKTFKKTYVPDNELINYKYDYEILEDEGGKYIYKDISTKLDEPEENKEYMIEKEDGTIEFVTRMEEYSDVPVKSVHKHNFEYMTLFSLPHTTIKLDRRPRKYIDQFKNNQIPGYFVKYYDKDGNIRIKIHSVDGITFQRATCDVSTIFLDMMPLVPHFSQMEVVNPIWVESNIFHFWFGALATGDASRFFYYIYDKKVNAYFNNTFKFPIKQWDRYINGEYEDPEYKVKLPKKVSRKITNEKSIYYTPPSLQNIENDNERRNVLRSNRGESYDGFYGITGRGTYGVHISFRFSFAIFFSKLVRRTKTLNKAAIEYLEFYWKNFGGILDIPFSTYVYPADRIQYIEKQLKLSFIKRKLTDLEAESLNGVYYSKFEYDLGRITFFNKPKKVKYELDVNTLYPNWKRRFFDNKVYFKKSFANKYNYLTIRESDIAPLIYTDSFGGVSENDKPLNVYKYENGAYKLTIKSYYYETPVIVRYNTKNGARTRTFHLWNRNSNEFCCFYTPYNLDEHNKYQYQDEALKDFVPRNVAYYLYNIFSKMSKEEVRNYYSEIYNIDKDDIIISNIIDNPFDHNKIFSKGLFAPTKELEWSKLTEETVSQTAHTVSLITVEDNFTGEDGSVIVKIENDNIALEQAYELYKGYSSTRLLNTDSTRYIPKSFYIWKIIDYLFISDLPAKKIITLKEFQHYFIDYDKNGTLAKIFSSSEIYDIGFTNYLVSNSDEDLNEPSVILAKIFTRMQSLIVDAHFSGEEYEVNGSWGEFYYDEINDVWGIHSSDGVNPDDIWEYGTGIWMESYWLPLPVDAYNKFPYYAKMFCTTYFSTIEYYHTQSVPTWNHHIASHFGVYTFFIGMLSLGWAILTAVINFISGNYAGAIMILLGVFFKTIGYILEFASTMIAGKNNSAARDLEFAAYGAKLVGDIFILMGSIVSIFEAFGGGAEGLAGVAGATASISSVLSIVNIVITIVNLILTIVNYAIGVKYNNLILEEIATLNNKIDEYNESVNKVWEFIEKHEGEDIGLVPQASMILVANLDANNDPYQQVYNFYTEAPLTNLYTDLDIYYDNRTI